MLSPDAVRLGMQVTYDAHAVLRRREERRKTAGRTENWKVWTSYRAQQQQRDPRVQLAPDTQHALAVGVRHLSDGVIAWYGDEPIEYSARDHHAAILLVNDLRRRPFLVSPEHVTPWFGRPDLIMGAGPTRLDRWHEYERGSEPAPRDTMCVCGRREGDGLHSASRQMSLGL